MIDTFSPKLRAAGYVVYIFATTTCVVGCPSYTHVDDVGGEQSELGDVLVELPMMKSRGVIN